MTIQLRRLTPAHLEQLILLERQLYPTAFQMSVGDIQNPLIWAELRGRNHSVGAFDGDKLVGYLMSIYGRSELQPSRDVLAVPTMAVHRAYRREAVMPMLRWGLVEALLSGTVFESRFRETTSYRMIMRNWALFRRFGFRITAIAPRDSIGGERVIFLRFEHIFVRDPVLRVASRNVGHLYRTYRKSIALPRRILEKICRSLPNQIVPLWLRRLSYRELAKDEADLTIASQTDVAGDGESPDL